MKVDAIADALTEDVQALLPSSMVRLARIIGLRAVVELVKHHGGGAPLYIPKEASPDHALWEQIGAEAFKALVQSCQGDRIEIPKCEKAAREILYRHIRHQHFVCGVSQGDLALANGYTARHIRSVLYYKPEATADARQIGLF